MGQSVSSSRGKVFALHLGRATACPTVSIQATFVFLIQVRRLDAVSLPLLCVYRWILFIWISWLEPLCFRWQYQAVLLVALFSISIIQPHILWNTMLLLSVLSRISRSNKRKNKTNSIFIRLFLFNSGPELFKVSLKSVLNMEKKKTGMFYLVQLKAFLHQPTVGYGMQVGTEKQTQRENASMWIWEEQEWCEVLGCSWVIQERECMSMLRDAATSADRYLLKRARCVEEFAFRKKERRFFLDVDRGKGPLASERKI